MTLTRRLATRTVRLVATFVLVTFLTAFLLDLVPGSPAEHMAGEFATPDVVQAIEQKYHFDQPLPERYWHWLQNALRGDLGSSYSTRQPVYDTIKDRLPITFELAALATLLALAIAVPCAIATARRPRSWFDRLVSGTSSAAISIPGFAVALVLSYALSYRVQLFPLFGWTRLTENPLENLRSAALPVVSIALVQAVILMRVFHADLVHTLQQDFVALARSKGLSKRAIMWKHALRPSLFSLMTLSALTFSNLLGGTVIVESIFQLPGLGSYALSSIASKDLVAVQGVVAFVALSFLIINFLVDVLYGVLDPRTRVSA